MQHSKHLHQHHIDELSRLRNTRRNFIKQSIALGILSSTSGLLISCNTTNDKIEVLDEDEEKTLIIVQNILFPKDDTGPGAYDVNAHKYVIWCLNDERLDTDEKNYVLKGFKWINETAQETHDKAFLSLDKKEQVDLIYDISETTWGDNWLSVMLTYIFEALISDPLYGFNQNGIGWTWIDHQVGLPRPTETLKYPTIFETFKHNNAKTQ